MRFGFRSLRFGLIGRHAAGRSDNISSQYASCRNRQHTLDPTVSGTKTADRLPGNRNRQRVQGESVSVSLARHAREGIGGKFLVLMASAGANYHLATPKVPAEEVWVYDPLFTPIEVALLKHRGYQLISKNEVGTAIQ